MRPYTIQELLDLDCLAFIDKEEFLEFRKEENSYEMKIYEGEMVQEWLVATRN